MKKIYLLSILGIFVSNRFYSQSDSTQSILEEFEVTTTRVSEKSPIAHENISKEEKIIQLKEELAELFQQPRFLLATTMGQIVKMQLKHRLAKSLALIPKTNIRVAD